LQMTDCAWGLHPFIQIHCFLLRLPGSESPHERPDASTAVPARSLEHDHSDLAEDPKSRSEP